MATSDIQVLGWDVLFKRRCFVSLIAMDRVSQFGYISPISWIAEMQLAFAIFFFFASFCFSVDSLCESYCIHLCYAFFMYHKLVIYL